MSSTPGTNLELSGPLAGGRPFPLASAACGDLLVWALVSWPAVRTFPR
ncbi:MAG: hypothetical protein ACXW2Y_02645 [Acidimicrobiia bacterium]